MRKRWLPVGLLALGVFALNAAARFITWKLKIVEEGDQVAMGLIAVTAAALLLAAAAAWWGVRYPLSRVFGDISVAVLIGAVLSLTVGPFAGGVKPFEAGLEGFVTQMLLFLGIAAVGLVLGYGGVVAFGKDWRSQGLLAYEQRYATKPRRPARG